MMLFVPIPFMKVNASGITMTAGTSGSFVGYQNAVAGTAFGSITDEPLVGETMRFLYYTTSPFVQTSLGFAGDIVAMLSAMSLYVDETPYALSGATLASGHTRVNWISNTGPQFVNGNSYTIRIE